MRRKSDEFVPFCLQCDYNLTGLKEHRCPECGTAFDLAALRKRALHGPPVTVFRAVMPNLILAPVFLSIPTVFLGLMLNLLEVPIGLPIFAIIFLIYLVRNAKRVRGLIQNNVSVDRKNNNSLSASIASGGMAVLLLFQIVPLGLFWGGLIWLIIKYPPRLFPF